MKIFKYPWVQIGIDFHSSNKYLWCHDKSNDDNYSDHGGDDDSIDLNILTLQSP